MKVFAVYEEVDYEYKSTSSVVSMWMHKDDAESEVRKLKARADELGDKDISFYVAVWDAQ